MTINNNEELEALLRLEAAVRVRNYVKANSTGNDLGMSDEAVVVVKINMVLEELNAIRGYDFNDEAAYNELMSQHNNKEEEG